MCGGAAAEAPNKGVEFRALGRYAEALACQERALELNPRYAMAWNNKGNVLDGLGQTAEALACFDQAIAFDSCYEKGWHNKGVGLRKLERHQEALAYFDRAVEINPRYAKAWFNRGGTLLTLQRPYEALMSFEEAQRLGYSEPQVQILCEQFRELLGVTVSSSPESSQEANELFLLAAELMASQRFEEPLFATIVPSPLTRTMRKHGTQREMRYWRWSDTRRRSFAVSKLWQSTHNMQMPG